MSTPSWIVVNAYTALVNARTDIQDNLREQGGCDHSAGICQCAQQKTLDQVEKSIADLAPYVR